VRFLRANAAFLTVTAVYLAATGFTQLYLGRPWSVLLTARVFVPVWCVLSVFYFVAELARYPRGLPDRGRFEIGSALAFAGCLLLMQGAFHASKQSIGHVAGFPWDPAFARLDAALHGTDPWRYLHAVLPAWGRIGVDRFYATWGLLAMAFSTWCTWSRSPFRDQARLAWMLTWVWVGTVGAWVFASAGPIFYEKTTGSSYFVPLLDSLGSSWSMNQAIEGLGWQAFALDLNVPMGGLSAMPSMHVAGSTLVAIVAANHSRRAGWLFSGFAVLTLIGSVTLGWHYAIDGYLGALLAWVCWRAAGRIVGRRATRTESPAPTAVPRTS